MRHCCCILLLMLMLACGANAQRFGSLYNCFEVRCNYGATVPVNASMDYLLHSNILLGELSYSVKTAGRRSWQHLWRFPEVGGAYLMCGTGNINVLGFTQSLFGFIGVPIIETDKLTFKYRLGCGIAYISDKYENKSNVCNVVTGSNVNGHIHLSLLLDYQPFSFPLSITGGIAYNHFFNGGVESPSLGLHQLTADLGLRYMYSEYDYSLPKRMVPYLYNKNLEISCFYLTSLREASIYDNRKYMLNALGCDVAVRVTNKYAVGGGLTVYHNPTLRPLLHDGGHAFVDNLQIALYSAHEMYISDNFSIPISAGVFVLSKYKFGHKILWHFKSGMRYMFNNRMFINILFQTYDFSTTYIEFGMGVKFG